ncbi:hypothetical protein [Halorarius halobius]|uniref:hypothetical protein n=1 Tax=Halorarius halobius TaxID=2962671 RepID=UPI0020CC107A|nr:hypothetical protein [Halorarius halobius]
MDPRVFECVECGATFPESERGDDTLLAFRRHVERRHPTDLEILDGDYLYFLDQHSEGRLDPDDADLLDHDGPVDSADEQ